MKTKFVLALGICLLPLSASAVQTMYCPQNSGYISIGMTQDQVVSACGQPLSKRKSDSALMQKVPVKQLIWTTLNQGSYYPGLNSAFYNQWSLSSGSTGVNLEIDIINNKVNSIKLNSSNTNSATICGGPNSIQVGDDISKVYTACGTPSTVNSTYVSQPVPSNSSPEVWVYQVNQYQSPYSLTFLDGKLQSIE